MWEQIESNQNKSIALIFFMAVFLLGLGYILAEAIEPKSGIYGLTGAFIVWVIMTLTSFWGGDSILLSVSGAKKINPQDHQMLYNVVEEMTIASGLAKVPDIYIIDDEAPNAFATGRNPDKAAVAITSGLLKMLSRDELQGVMAHELSHVNNRDTLYMTIAGIMMGAIVLIADAGARTLFRTGGGRSRSSGRGGGQAQLVIFLVAIILMIIAPIVARIFYYTVSRKREYLADACASQYTRYPEGLANALAKIGGAGMKMKKTSEATAPMYIVNPLKAPELAFDGGNFWGGLFSTHPPLGARIKVLKSMVGADYKAYDKAFSTVTGSSSGVIGASSLTDAQDVAIRETAEPDSPPEAIQAHVENVRTTTDVLWKMNNYIFISCECGTKLKIPPAYLNKVISCPHCMQDHTVVPSQQDATVAA